MDITANRANKLLHTFFLLKSFGWFILVLQDAADSFCLLRSLILLQLAAGLAHTVRIHFGKIDLMAAAARRLSDHAGHICLHIDDIAAAAAHQMHVLVADVFIHRTALSNGEPADQPHLGQMIECAIHRRRTNMIKAVEDLLSSQVTASARQNFQHGFRLCTDSSAHRSPSSLEILW